MTRLPLAPQTMDLLDIFLDSVSEDVVSGKDAFAAARSHRRSLVVFLENAVTQILHYEFSISPCTMPSARAALNVMRQDGSWTTSTPAATRAVAVAIGDLLYDWTDLTQGGGYSGNASLPTAILEQKVPRLLAALDRYAADRGEAKLSLRLRRLAARVEETFNAGH